MLFFLQNTGTPSVTDGNRVMMFDLTKLTEAKESQVLIQLVIKTPTQQYFQSAKHLSLFKDCLSCPDASEPHLVAHHTLLDTERDTEWLELTVQCASCNWKELDQISFVLQLTDDNDVPIAFTQKMAEDMKTFLVLYTYNSSTFLYESISRALERRQVSESNSMLENRTTIQELLDNNVTCSKQDILLTAEELQFRGTIVSSPHLIQFSYCFGECSHNLEAPANVNETLYDSRTRTLIHNLNMLHAQLHPPPCCIPNGLTTQDLILSREEVVELETIPNVVECKCQF